MKYLYILLLYLPSGFGRLTQKMPHYKYTHVALWLDDSYTLFYAFSRLLSKYEIFEGAMENDRHIPKGDNFFKETPRLEYITKTLFIVRELIYRQIFGWASKSCRPEKVRLY